MVTGFSYTQLRWIGCVHRLGGSYLGRYDAETATVAVHAGLDFGQLSLSERLQLVEDLWDSIGDEHIPMPDWHRKELDRRLADYRANPEAGIPREEVRARLAKLVG